MNGFEKIIASLVLNMNNEDQLTNLLGLNIYIYLTTDERSNKYSDFKQIEFYSYVIKPNAII